jgi:hypothetical protein
MFSTGSLYKFNTSEERHSQTVVIYIQSSQQLTADEITGDHCTKKLAGIDWPLDLTGPVDACLVELLDKAQPGPTGQQVLQLATRQCSVRLVQPKQSYASQITARSLKEQ